MCRYSKFDFYILKEEKKEKVFFIITTLIKINCILAQPRKASVDLGPSRVKPPFLHRDHHNIGVAVITMKESGV